MLTVKNSNCFQYIYEKIRETSSDSLFDSFSHLTARHVAINELIMSEQRFVDDMKNILKTYITPMLEKKILSSSHIDALFLNWPSLTRIHEKLANELIDALKIHGEEVPIGTILCEFIPELTREYEVYFRFHPVAMKCFRQQIEKSLKFRLFMEKTKIETSGIGTLGDANILTLPLQRLAKYPFLLDQIIKNTSDTCANLSDLERSLQKSNEFQQTINNAIDEEINRVRFDWLQTHVDCRALPETIIFNSLTHFGEQRKLIHYNQLKFSKRSFYTMLFNDFLLLTTIKRPLIRKFWQIVHRQTKTVNDWFETPSSDYLHLIIYKKPIMLHEIRNLRIDENNSNLFRFDYRGREMKFLTNSINERVLWMKHLTESIDICRQRCLATSMCRAPESFLHCESVGKISISQIQILNYSCLSQSKASPYCIVEMNDSQRQTTTVLSESKYFHWNVSYEFLLANIDSDRIKFSIYNQSKYTIDRLLGSIELPISSLIESSCEIFDLENSSKNCQLSLKYHVH